MLNEDVKLMITDIQHFSTGDGPGIRTTVFTKGCNLHCPWCHNPETISPKPQMLYYQVGKVITKKLTGSLVRVCEIAEKIENDIDFYRESGGGVTVSGGECMLQADALVPLLDRLKQKNIHIIIDTAGCVAYSEFRKINPYVDCYFYDIKTADEEKYSKIVGGSIKRILDNFKSLRRDGKEVRVRIPIIPGFNADVKECERLANLLEQIGAETVDLLPFHRLGSGKYKAMNLSYAYKDLQPIDIELLRLLKKQFDQKFITNVEI